MAIAPADCAPYLSATLFKIKPETANIATKMRKAIASEITKPTTSPDVSTPIVRKVKRVHPDAVAELGFSIAWIHYSEERSPAWYGRNDLLDRRNHVVFIFVRNNILALTFSDSAMRNSVVSQIKKSKSSPFKKLTLLSPAEINNAFVEKRVRTLWLSGTHRRTAIKADSKVLSGIELESALNPLEDQSYYFSSVRSTSNNERLRQHGAAAVIGANPTNARIWLGPTPNWDMFVGKMDALVEQVQTALNGQISDTAPLPILAQPVQGLGTVEKPYGMAIIVPELLFAGYEDDNGEPWLNEFSDAALFKPISIPGSPSFEADIYWGAERYGRLSYKFELTTEQSVSLKTKIIDWEAHAYQQDDVLKICRNPDYLSIYYDTGHTFSRGQFYQTQFRDAKFIDWHWVSMADFDYHREKPLDGRKLDIPGIGSADDNSLFGFTAKYWPNLVKREPARGWLVCDDGSMESADFIHFDATENPPKLTLIHIKGSGSDNSKRGVSVTDYEVVVGQAVKNLRHLDRNNIADKLYANKGNVIGSAVWHDNARQQNRDALIAALRTASSNMETEVVVFQPRVRKKAYDAIREYMESGKTDREDVRRLRQLDALLLSARAECNGLGASFIVIGDDD